MKHVVIDTNVLVSSVISLEGNPAKIMDMIADKQLLIHYSPDILDEYRRVLSYKKLCIALQTQAGIIHEIEKLGISIEPTKSATPLPDESDRIFYDTAKASGAILVTGNTKHYPAESFIMTPADFLKESELNTS